MSAACKFLTPEQKVTLVWTVEKGEEPLSVMAEKFNILVSALSTVAKSNWDVCKGGANIPPICTLRGTAVVDIADEGMLDSEPEEPSEIPTYRRRGTFSV